MRMPREILLGRHRAAEEKLDAIRQNALAAVCDLRGATGSAQARRPQTAATNILQALWRELYLPNRRIWTGLAVIWILIFAVNFSQRNTVSSVTGKPVRAPAVMMSWQTQQRLVAELLADRAIMPDADRPRQIRALFGVRMPRREGARPRDLARRSEDDALRNARADVPAVAEGSADAERAPRGVRRAARDEPPRRARRRRARRALGRRFHDRASQVRPSRELRPDAPQARARRTTE